MYFQTRILFVSFVATVVLSIFIIPLLRKLKIGQIERDDGPESHFKKEGTPTMGGVIIALGIIIRNNRWMHILFCKGARSCSENSSTFISCNRIWTNRICR